MHKHWVVLVSTIAALGAVAAAGAGAGVFGSQSSVRTFARLAHRVMPAAGKPAPNVGRLR